MFYDRFESRVETWRDFRQLLEVCSDPIAQVIEFWNRAPISTRTCDPYDKAAWPGPWELLDENEYCDFGKVLAIYYTLSLTDRFRDEFFEISVCLDRKKQQQYYLLYVGDQAIGYYYDRAVDRKNLPLTLDSLANYVLASNDYH